MRNELFGSPAVKKVLLTYTPSLGEAGDLPLKILDSDSLVSKLAASNRISKSQPLLPQFVQIRAKSQSPLHSHSSLPLRLHPLPTVSTLVMTRIAEHQADRHLNARSIA